MMKAIEKVIECHTCNIESVAAREQFAAVRELVEAVQALRAVASRSEGYRVLFTHVTERLAKLEAQP